MDDGHQVMAIPHLTLQDFHINCLLSHDNKFHIKQSHIISDCKENLDIYLEQPISMKAKMLVNNNFGN